jgi:ribosomal protein L40E
MVGIVALVALVSAPALLTNKCPHCGQRNGLEAKICRKCGGALPPATS